MSQRLTAPAFRARKRAAGSVPISMVTAYDASCAAMVAAAGVDAILVGDSLGMVVQGHAHTLPVRLSDMVYHTQAVVRGAPHTLVIADLPFMSYQTSVEQAVASAGALVQQGQAQMVKLEGGAVFGPHVRAITAAGIPVMGHLGLTPQSVHAFGGFRVQGRGEAAEAALRGEAQALVDAGVFAVLLEAIPAALAAEVTASLSVPTIGIGAGAACDGQVLVLHDLLGLTPGPVPRFAKAYSDFATRGRAAVAAYVDEVQRGIFPDAAHSYGTKARSGSDAT
ncbi:MAG: 3-methyl-2-oxobutanoate hydroxymethyltransferase [Polyangiales bacterium]